MGFSLVAAFAVIAVSILTALEIFTGAVLPSITDTIGSHDKMVERSIEKLHTNINITTVTVSANNSNYDYNITVKNIGSVSLKTSDFIILINGTLQQFNCSTKYLHPEKKVSFFIYNLPGNGTKQLKVITNNGISAYYEYKV
jgi:archaellum component FlaF (FlaF/FlaG flagellin family)